MKEKNIIGYLAPFDLYNGDVVKNTVFILDSKTGMYTTKYTSDYQLPSEIVKKWSPVYDKYEEGTWVILNASNLAFNKKIEFIGPARILEYNKNVSQLTNVEYPAITKYNSFRLVNGEILYFDAENVHTYIEGIASEDVIMNELISHAKLLGFTAGVRFKSLDGIRVRTMNDGGWYYSIDGDILSKYGITVYSDGNWAEIIKDSECMQINVNDTEYEVYVSNDGLNLNGNDLRLYKMEEVLEIDRLIKKIKETGIVVSEIANGKDNNFRENKTYTTNEVTLHVDGYDITGSDIAKICNAFIKFNKPDVDNKGAVERWTATL